MQQSQWCPPHLRHKNPATSTKSPQPISPAEDDKLSQSQEQKPKDSSCPPHLRFKLTQVPAKPPEPVSSSGKDISSEAQEQTLRNSPHVEQARSLTSAEPDHSDVVHGTDSSEPAVPEWNKSPCPDSEGSTKIDGVNNAEQEPVSQDLAKGQLSSSSSYIEGSWTENQSEKPENGGITQPQSAPSSPVMLFNESPDLELPALPEDFDLQQQDVGEQETKKPVEELESNRSGPKEDDESTPKTSHDHEITPEPATCIRPKIFEKVSPGSPLRHMYTNQQETMSPSSMVVSAGSKLDEETAVPCNGGIDGPDNASHHVERSPSPTENRQRGMDNHRSRGNHAWPPARPRRGRRIPANTARQPSNVIRETTMASAVDGGSPSSNFGGSCIANQGSPIQGKLKNSSPINHADKLANGEWITPPKNSSAGGVILDDTTPSPKQASPQTRHRSPLTREINENPIGLGKPAVEDPFVSKVFPSHNDIARQLKMASRGSGGLSIDAWLELQPKACKVMSCLTQNELETIANRKWAEYEIPGIENLDDFWKHIITSSISTVDEGDLGFWPWWKTYKTDKSLFLKPYDVPDAHLDPDDNTYEVAKAEPSVVQKMTAFSQQLLKEKQTEAERYQALLTNKPQPVPKVRVQMPKLKIKLRSAEQRDWQQMIKIYNHNIITSWGIISEHKLDEEEFAERFYSLGEKSLPFIVAIKAKGNTKRLSMESESPVTSFAVDGEDEVMGYAWIDDYGPPDSIFFRTGEIEIHVRQEYQDQKIGKALLDHLLYVVDQGYQKRCEVEWSDNSRFGLPHSTRPFRALIANVVYAPKGPHRDMARYRWMKDWLERYKFSKVGELQDIGERQGLSIHHATFARYCNAEYYCPKAPTYKKLKKQSENGNEWAKNKW